MTDIGTSEQAPAPLNDRLLFAIRQAALLAVSLLIAGLVTERLRPLEVTDRGIASTPFLWAIVAWFVVLLFNAIAFEQSRIKLLEQAPLTVSVGIGGLLFVIGLFSLDGASLGRRILYLIANSLGAVMFWWALLSIGALVLQRFGER